MSPNKIETRKKLNSFVFVTFASLNTLFQCFKNNSTCFTVYVSYFNIPYYSICTTAFTITSCKLDHNIKIRPVSASQSVYSKDFLFFFSFWDLMFLLLGNTYVITYTSLQCMARIQYSCQNWNLTNSQFEIGYWFNLHLLMKKMRKLKK